MLNERDCKRLIKRIKNPERRAKYEAKLALFKNVVNVSTGNVELIVV